MREIERFLRIFFRLMFGFYITSPEKKTGATRKTQTTLREPSLTTTTTVTTPAPTTAVPNPSGTTAVITTTGVNVLTTTTSVFAPPRTTTDIISTTASEFLSTTITTTSPETRPLTTDPRLSWIYDLSKEDLKREMKKYGLETMGSADDLRKRFSRFWKATAGLLKPATPNVTLEPTFDQSVNLAMQLQATTDEMASVREILGLSPNANGNHVRRMLSDLVKTNHTPTRFYTPDAAGQHPLFPPTEPVSVTYSQDFYGSRLVTLPTTTTTTYLTTQAVPHTTYAPIKVHDNRGFRGILDLPSPPREATLKYQETAHNRSHRSKDLAVLCNDVRKWNIRFDGRRDPVSFLERLQELIEAYDVPQDEILRAMPELLSGSALLWYRNCKELWTTYDEFRRQFELQFLPPGYHRALDEEIRKRTQGDSESFRNYVVAITTLVRRRGTFSTHDRLELIFSNMRPEYKVMIRRQDFGTLAQLMERAEDYEAYVRDKSTFRPPPPPNMSLVQETAYHPKKRPERSWDSAVVNNPPPSPLLPPSQSIERYKQLRHTQGVKQVSNLPGSTTKSATATGLLVRFPEQNNRPPTRRPTTYDRRDERPSRRVVTCWNCDQTGHLYRECRQEKVLRCYYCKTAGVPTTRCPCRSGNDNRAQPQGGHLEYPTDRKRPLQNGSPGSSQ